MLDAKHVKTVEVPVSSTDPSPRKYHCTGCGAEDHVITRCPDKREAFQARKLQLAQEEAPPPQRMRDRSGDNRKAAADLYRQLTVVHANVMAVAAKQTAFHLAGMRLSCQMADTLLSKLTKLHEAGYLTDRQMVFAQEMQVEIHRYRNQVELIAQNLPASATRK